MINPDAETVTLPTAFLEQLSRASTLEEVLRLAAYWLTELFPAQRGSAVFLHGGQVRSSAHWADGRHDVIDTSDVQPRAGSIRARVMADGRDVMMTAADLLGAPEPIYGKLYDQGLRHLLLVPMLARDTPVGILSLGRDGAERFTQAQGQFLRIIGQSVAAQVMLMEQLRQAARAAETDALTGLGNRVRLMRVLSGAGDGLHQPDSAGRVLGLLQIDLDHFKDVNDNFGHATGDALLVHAAGIMRDTVGPRDVVVRTGGDEFVVLTRTDPAGQELLARGQRIVERLAAPATLTGRAIQISCSIGAALASAPSCDPGKLIAMADVALYAVKRSGRCGVQLFTASMRSASQREAQLLDDLRLAQTANDFVPYFQPQVAMGTGNFSGFEILARWDHPKLGLLDPSDFLELAREAGLSEQIDRIVRQKGIAALRQLRSEGWEAPKMSFNASARTLASGALVRMLRSELAAAGLRPKDLVVEVRERELRTLGHGAAYAALAELADAGFEVELDDFGSGLSCMSTLSQAPISAIKLDPALTGLLPDQRAEMVLSATIRLARDLGIASIAEGVETAEQFQRLRALGCGYAQGYGICAPMPLEALTNFMRDYGKAPLGLAANTGRPQGLSA